jgi:hypothetical protein
MAVRRQYCARRKITSIGYDALGEVLESTHIPNERNYSLAYLRHILALVQYRAILLFQDNVG